jgi:radical SAM superfamily enzyme YgiQ (UPF0313 family)
VRVLLISTYDLGRQPFGLASAAAALAASGVDVTCLDLAKQKLDEAVVGACAVVAFYLPMHTATRLALPVIERVRRLNPRARLGAFGLYAPLNAALLRARGVEHTIGGEFEDELTAFVAGTSAESAPVDPQETRSTREKDSLLSSFRPVSGPGQQRPRREVARVHFRIPLRETLPPLSQYASVQIGGDRRTAGYTEASRGCKHRCRHCPIVPVYDGRFRIVPQEIVLADVRAQVAGGARHITFGDPDFLNGVRHATELVRALHAEFPEVSYDVTIKIEHLLRHADLLATLRETNCLFVTSAVESVDDEILLKLEKGHTRAGVEEAVRLCRAAGLTLAPTFVAFTPWTTVAGYCELLQVIDCLDLVDHVAPIQLAIRLLVPEGSRLLDLPDVRAIVGPYSAASLIYPWSHADPAVDALQRQVERLVGVRIGADRQAVFSEIWELAHSLAESPRPARRPPLISRAAIPYLNEPWYC